MSHFTVLVTKTNEKDIDRQLAPFDEGREMPSHISITRADFIERGRKDIEHAKAKIAEYDADPAAYEASTSNKRHLEWINGEARELIKIIDEDELFKIGAKWYLSDGVLDEDGNYWSTDNDDAKWDWYQVGGRWAGFFVPKIGAESGEKGEITLLSSPKDKFDFATNNRVDVIKVKDIDWDAMDAAERTRRGEYYDEEMAKEDPSRRFIWEDRRDDVLKMSRDEYIAQPVSHSTFAVLHDGKWYERGEMGWFAMVSNEKDPAAWDSEWRKLIESLDPDTEVTVVDCHI